MSDDEKGCIFPIIGLIIIIAICYFCFRGKNNEKTADELYEEKTWDGTYSATVKGSHEYKRDANGNEYVRSDTVTIIE